MKLRWTLLVWVFMLAAACAPSQERSRFAVQGIGYGRGMQAGSDVDVQKAPFSAETVYEFDRILADGNRIHQETRKDLPRF